MSIEKKAQYSKKRWLRFGLKTLFVGILAATTPFISVKYYEGKQWHPPGWGALNPAIKGRYFIKKYSSILGEYGVTKFHWHRDYDDDGNVDEITHSVTYPSWMKEVPILNALLPKNESGDISKLEVWLRGAVAEKFTKRYFMPPRKCYSTEKDPPEPALDTVPPKQNETNLRIYQTSDEVEKSDAKHLFDEADELFQKWYPNNEPMPYEPRDDERWALFSRLKEKN